jgi:hypothetical protein
MAASAPFPFLLLNISYVCPEPVLSFSFKWLQKRRFPHPDGAFPDRFQHSIILQEKKRKKPPFFLSCCFALRLSRACLGKMIVFSINMARTNGVFLPGLGHAVRRRRWDHRPHALPCLSVSMENYGELLPLSTVIAWAMVVTAAAPPPTLPALPLPASSATSWASYLSTVGRPDPTAPR